MVQQFDGSPNEKTLIEFAKTNSKQVIRCPVRFCGLSVTRMLQ